MKREVRRARRRREKDTRGSFARAQRRIRIREARRFFDARRNRVYIFRSRRPFLERSRFGRTGGGLALRGLGEDDATGGGRLSLGDLDEHAVGRGRDLREKGERARQRKRRLTRSAPCLLSTLATEERVRSRRGDAKGRLLDSQQARSSGAQHARETYLLVLPGHLETLACARGDAALGRDASPGGSRRLRGDVGGDGEGHLVR